jgi:ABC-type transport system involved in multi-copper enzyme maturation permease subunit
LNAIRAIALNTFREAVRDRILYLLLVFALLMIASSRVVGILTVGDEDKIIKDVGLAAIGLFSVLTAIFVGVGLVFKEIERRTIYTVITKPIRRYQFIVGKYLGLVLTLLVNMSIMTVGYYALLLARGAANLRLLEAIALSFVEVLVVTALAVFFSAFSTPILSGIFTLSSYVLGHLSWSFLLLRDRLGEGTGSLVCEVLYRVIPNLERFNIKAEVVHGLVLPSGRVLWATLYGVGWTALILAAAAFAFSRRDFQ